MVFPVVKYGCESWTIKKGECRRLDAFELWCWKRLLRVPWTARRSNQSILKEISPELFIRGTDVEAEAPILWPRDAKSWLTGKDPDAGKDWRRRRGWQRMKWLDGITDSVTWVWASSMSWWWTGRPGMLQSMGLQSGTTERLNWTES